MLLTRDSNDFGTAVIDGLTSHICVVDKTGEIIAVNRAWRNFAVENSHGRQHTFLKTNYLRVCDDAIGAGAEEAAAFAAGLRAVVRGDTDLFELEYTCNSPTNLQWFLARVTPFLLGQGGAIVSHINISDRKHLEQRLWTMASIDSLTGLPNRRLFYDKLKRRREQAPASPFAVGLIDLDRFKDINDTFGHDVGDNFLKTAAERLCDAVMEPDVLARIGGDEFGIIFDNVKTAQDIGIRMEPLFASLRLPTMVGSVARKISISVGISFASSPPAAAGDLLKHADLAMYEAKAKGGNGFELFSPALRESMDRAAQLRSDVERALENKEFILFYQPVMLANRSRLIGLEALLRWKHPEKGLLGAGAFSEAFDDKRLASAIGSAVIELALVQAQQWNTQRHLFGRIAINVTVWDFIQKDFPAYLKQRLDFFRVSPNQVCIEVTERLFLNVNEDTVATALAELHGMGCEIALDDFGTGFASLSHLKTFPVDRLKIDRSFISNLANGIDDLAIVGSIVRLGRGLGISVTAEGVETAEQLEVLQTLGCDCVQGYLIARPMPGDEVGTFISACAGTIIQEKKKIPPLGARLLATTRTFLGKVAREICPDLVRRPKANHKKTPAARLLYIVRSRRDQKNRVKHE